MSCMSCKQRLFMPVFSCLFHHTHTPPSMAVLSISFFLISFFSERIVRVLVYPTDVSYVCV